MAVWAEQEHAVAEPGVCHIAATYSVAGSELRVGAAVSCLTAASSPVSTRANCLADRRTVRWSRGPGASTAELTQC